MIKQTPTRDKIDCYGMATVYNVLCTDGRTIATNTFAHENGKTVPLVWKHGHDSIDNILGKVWLESKPTGLAAFCAFLDSKQGEQGRVVVQSGVVDSFSIYATDVVEDRRGIVTFGNILEVSLVFSGANPNAKIKEVFYHGESYDPYDEDNSVSLFVSTRSKLKIVHDSDNSTELDPETDDEMVENLEETDDEMVENLEETDDEMVENLEETDDDFLEETTEVSEEILEETTEVSEEILEETTDVSEEVYADISHSDDETIGDILRTLNADQNQLLAFLLHSSLEETKSTLTNVKEGPTFDATFDTLTEKQKNVIHFVVGEQKTDISQGEDMTHTIYEGVTNTNIKVLAHDDIAGILSTILADSTTTSLKKAFLAHTLTYGVEGVEILMPEAQNVRGDGEPYLNKKDKMWVERVLGAVDHVGFSKIRSTYADIDEDIARARGYITGATKFSAVYRVFGRETTAQTVYTRQQMDRDQVIEITAFNMLNWLKKIMYIKQREELAQAILIGDFRAIDHADKIFPDKIRDVYTDDAIYSHKVLFPMGHDIIQIVDGIVENQKYYKGGGTPTFYCSQEVFTAMMLVRDNDDHRQHKTRDELLAALLINDLVVVTPMSGVIRVEEEAPNDEFQLLGILVNLQDYSVGTNKGGETTWFEGFDLDVNRHKALVETRICGALVTPKSALVFEQALQ